MVGQPQKKLLSTALPYKRHLKQVCCQSTVNNRRGGQTIGSLFQIDTQGATYLWPTWDQSGNNEKVHSLVCGGGRRKIWNRISILTHSRLQVVIPYLKTINSCAIPSCLRSIRMVELKESTLRARSSINSASLLLLKRLLTARVP